MSPRVSALALIALLAAGCASPADPVPASEGPVAPSVPAPDALELAATITDTLVVEGYPEPVTLRLVHEDEGVLPFATYVPEGIDYESVAADEGVGYRFTAGTPPGPEAVLFLFVPSETDGLVELDAYAQALADGAPLEEMPPEVLEGWAERGVTWRRGDRFGSVRAGQHDGRRFYLVEDMQMDMGDGFSPRATMILNHWRWLPEGTPLTP